MPFVSTILDGLITDLAHPVRSAGFKRAAAPDDESAPGGPERRSPKISSCFFSMVATRCVRPANAIWMTSKSRRIS